MKFKVNQKELNDAISVTQRAVASKSALPSLEGILVKTMEDTLYIVGYNLEFGIITQIPAEIEEKGEIVLNARLFGDIVRRLSDGTVSVSIDEAYSAQIKCGNSEFGIIGMSAEEYPEIPTIYADDELSLPEGLLKSMIRQTLFAVAVTDNKPVHKGTLFEAEDGRLRLVSVDGYRLAVRTVDIKEDAVCRFVVPGKTLSEIVKLLSDSEERDAKLLIGKRHIRFEINGYTVFSRLLEGEFLDYKNTIPKGCTTTVTVNTSDFINTIDRVSLLITERLKSPLRCVFEDNTIDAYCITPMGRAHDSLSAKTEGEAVEIGFNNRYLTEALRAAESDEVKIELGGPLSPMKVMPISGDEFLFLVLPVRLKA